MASNLRRSAFLFLFLLGCSLVATAQQAYFREALDVKAENGKKIYSYEGKVLEGRCRINYIDSDFSAGYLVADYRGGIRGDTVRYYHFDSGVLRSEEIRLDDRATLCREYDYGADRPRRAYRRVGGMVDGIYREWYTGGKLYKIKEYTAGVSDGKSIEWDEEGRIRSVRFYRDGTEDGRSEFYTYEGPDHGLIEVCYHQQNDAPYLIEQYVFWRGQRGLDRRIVPDQRGRELYASRKFDCDSTRIDTVVNDRAKTGITVEIRDYSEGSLYSLERYSPNYAGEWIPDGVFERYAPDGRLAERMRYEEGELTATRSYDSDDEPCSDVHIAPLTKKEYDSLKNEFTDSKYFDQCVIQHPLQIRDSQGFLLFERDEADRRYEYWGYDPALKLHLAFSSIGDYNNVYFYILQDEGNDSYLEIQPALLAIDGNTGTIAALFSAFEGEYELVCYRHCISPEEGCGYFTTVFEYAFDNGPDAVWGLHWIGDHSLLLICGEEEFLRLDIAPEAFQEAYCPPEDEDEM